MGIKKGERHYNEYLNMTRMTDGQLERAIASYTGKVHEHLDKVANPSKYVATWHFDGDKYRDGLIAKWKTEIRNFEEKLALAQYVQKGRN